MEFTEKFASGSLRLDKSLPFCYPWEALNKSSFCGKRLEYMGFFRKNNLNSEVPLFSHALLHSSYFNASSIYFNASSINYRGKLL